MRACKPFPTMVLKKAMKISVETGFFNIDRFRVSTGLTTSEADNTLKRMVRQGFLQRSSIGVYLPTDRLRGEAEERGE